MAVKRAAKRVDPIKAEVMARYLLATAEEMGATLMRTAFSPNIKERADCSTAIFDAQGQVIALAQRVPIHLGSMVGAVDEILKRYPLREIVPGDQFVANDPYNGGVTHLNDMILVMPVFAGADIVAWTANIAHWNDVGGMVPGSMSTEAREIFQEGMILAGIKLFSRGQLIRSVFDILTANCRMPDFLTGDMWAGVASVRVGERRVLEIVSKYGKDVFLHAVEQYMEYGERVSIAALKALPKGTYSLVEEQDQGPPWNVTVEVSDREFIVDLRDNPDQDKGPFNMSRDEAVVSCQMAFKCATSPERVANGGTFRPLKVLTRHGSIFDPKFPAAMGIYYEMTIRLEDLVTRCLAQQLPDRLPAGSFASVCGTLFGGIHADTGRTYAVIEPELGGWGGSPQADGNPGQFSALHGETYNCPAEVAEARYGVTVDYLSFHDEDGGAGMHRGGKGVRIDYRMRSDNAWLTVAYTRSRVLPWPLKAGCQGSPNHVQIVRKDAAIEDHSVVSGLTVNKGDVIRIITGTGAGWGDPMKRDLELVKDDLRNGYITREQANRYYRLEERLGRLSAR